MEKHGDIRPATKERKRNYLVLEPNYDTTKCSTKSLLGIETT